MTGCSLEWDLCAWLGLGLGLDSRGGGTTAAQWDGDVASGGTQVGAAQEAEQGPGWGAGFWVGAGDFSPSSFGKGALLQAQVGCPLGGMGSASC